MQLVHSSYYLVLLEKRKLNVYVCSRCHFLKIESVGFMSNNHSYIRYQPGQKLGAFSKLMFGTRNRAIVVVARSKMFSNTFLIQILTMCINEWKKESKICSGYIWGWMGRGGGDTK